MRGSRGFRGLAFVVVLAALLAQILAPLGHAAAQSDDSEDPPPLDAAAVIPTPEELADAGFADYTLAGTGYSTLADDVAYLADALAVDPDDAEEALADAGWRTSYVAILSLREDPFDPGSAPVQDIQINIIELADEDGAADAYALVSDESGDPAAEDVPGASFGDESELTRRSGDEDSLTGLPYQELELQFQSGRLLTAVSIFVFGEDADEPAVDEIDALGAVIEERVDAILAGDSPDLTRFVPLLEPVEGAFPYAAYLLRDGDPIPQNFETAEAIAARVATYGGAAHVLSFQQPILSGEEGVEDDFYFYASLLQFESDDDATAFVNDTEERLEQNPIFVDFAEYDEAAGFGDASIGFERTVEIDGDELVRNQINIAVGDVVAALWVTQFTTDVTAPIEPLLELADAQAECLEAGGCDGFIPLPDGIVAEVDAGSSAGDDDDEPTEPASSGDLETYESEDYGFTVAYDPAIWMLSEMLSNSVAFEFEGPGSGAFLSIAGYEDYASREPELANCPATSLSWAESLEEIEARGEPLGGGEYGFFSYEATAAGEEGDLFLAYVECREFEGGLTLIVQVRAPEAEFDDAFAAADPVVDSLGGIEPVDAGDEPSDEPTEDAGDDPADDPTTGDGEVYESPQYGYTLTYDPNVWEVSSEDDDPDDAFDRVTLQSDAGFVLLIGDPDYDAGQMPDCLADYVLGLEQTDGVSGVQEIRGEDGEADDRAFAAFTYELETDDGQLDVARYIECRVLGDVTVVVIQTSVEAAYDDLSALREELLSGLDEA